MTADTTIAALFLLTLAALIVAPSTINRWRIRRTRARLRAELLAWLGARDSWLGARRG